ncbi:unnamed protein product [Rhodiola kirilowii]
MSTEEVDEVSTQMEDRLILTLEEEEWEKSAKEFARVLVLKPVSERKYSFNGIVAAMRKVWILKGKVTFGEAKGSRIIAKFQREDDLKRVFEGGPWTYGGCAILMSRWEEEASLEKQAFNRLGIWAQFHDVPEQLMTSEDTARKLARMIGEFIKVDQGEGSNQNFKYVRCRVWLDVSKPIITSFFLARRGKDPLQITVRYEHMPRFCHHCGVCTHEMEDCNKKSRSMAPLYEAWLKGLTGISGVVEDGDAGDKGEQARQVGKETEYRPVAVCTEEGKPKTLADEVKEVSVEWAGPSRLLGQLDMAWERVGDTESGVLSQIFGQKGSRVDLGSISKSQGGKQKATYSSNKKRLKVRVSDLKKRAREGVGKSVTFESLKQLKEGNEVQSVFSHGFEGSAEAVMQPRREP